MKSFLPIPCFAAILLMSLSLGIVEQANGQCTNYNVWSSATINTNGTVVTIDTCMYAGDYSTISGAVSGQTLRFTYSVSTDSILSSEFITIRSGTPEGPVLAFGQTPLEFVNTFTGTIYAHWNTDASCGTASSCHLTTVQCTSCNDLCTNAAAISCGQTLSGSTLGATFDNVGVCGISNTSSGVWYAFTGTGTPATISTCGQASFDTKLSVFTGFCGALVCVGGNDDFPGCSGFTSQLTFPTTVGTTYYVLVHGFGANTGTFSLSLTCAPVVLGCTDPAAINYNPNATTDNGSCIYPPATCAQALAVGVGTHNTGPINSGSGASNICTFPISGNAAHARYYTFTPAVTGEYTIGSAGLTTVDTRLSIHTGSCGDLACYASNDDVGGGSFASQVTECFTAGTTYYIEWDNRWSSTSFNWSIAFKDSCDNDLCANAAAISCGQTLSGTTVGAFIDGVDTCTVSNTAPGVWYAFTSTGTPATVSTCGQASFNTKLSVFTGSCGTLVCVGGNDDFPGCSGFTSQFTFPTTAGTTYYVLVHGLGTATGSFTLSLTCEPLNVDIQISDPCSCDDPLNVQPWGGMVQLFHDVLLVNIGLSGQNVTVSQSFNPANFVDINGDPIPVNTSLDDQGDGTYTLSFYRPPSTSFSVEIDVNGIYQEIFNSDTCLDAEACGVLPIPTMSEWGLIILALLMLQGIWLTLVFKPTNIPKDIPALWLQGLRAGLQDKNMLFIMIIIAVSVLSFMAFFNIAQAADIIGVPAALFIAIPVVYWYKKLGVSVKNDLAI